MVNVTKYSENDNQFYPTPASFLDKIFGDFMPQMKVFEQENKYNIKVLEPSAGKGDIVKYIKKHSGNESFYSYTRLPHCDIECIELDKTLQATLKGQNFVVVYDDFLTFETYTKYDLIFMNPPFAEADKHLLKAIRMQERYGGRILCIMNAITLQNLNTLAKKEISRCLNKYKNVIKIYASPFTSYDSERITDVDVAVVWIDIPTPFDLSSSTIFEKLDKAKEVKLDNDGATEQHELIKLGLDWISAYVMEYNEHVQSAIAFVKEYEAFRITYKTRFENIKSSKYDRPFNLKVYGKDFESINILIERIRYDYWYALFSNPKFTAKLTYRMQQDLQSRLDTFKHYDFTEHNILVLMQENANATIRGVKEAIIGLFDNFTKYAQYDGCDNVHYYNGWKTNSAHKLNKKIIIPFYNPWHRTTRYKFHEGCYGYCTTDGYEYKLEEHEAIRDLSELAKTLNYLAGGVCEMQDMEDLSSIIKTNFAVGNAKNIKFKHFTVTFYKKGTCHLTFNNEELLEKFNLFVSQEKGWLPPSYGKKHYTEMEKAEQKVVDEFQGAAMYEKIMSQTDKYFLNSSSLLALAETNA